MADRIEFEKISRKKDTQIPHEKSSSKKLSEGASILEREHSYFNAAARHATVLILSGTVDMALLIQSLEFLYWSHPLLRSTIRFDEMDVRYYLDFHLDFARIPIEVLSHQKENTWRSVLNKKLLEKFPTDRFLWELTVILEDNNRCVILQHFHHAICDGASTATLQHQLMMVYDALKNNRPVYLPEDVVLKTPAELFANSKTRSRRIKETKIFRENNPIPNGKTFDTFVDREYRTTQNILFAFDLTPLKSIIAQKNLELDKNYTVNNILVSALLMAYKKTRLELTNEIGLSTCVNLRKYFAHTLSDHVLDCLFEIIFTSHNIDESMSIWDIAFLYQIKLKETIHVMLQPAVDFDCASFLTESAIAEIKNRKAFIHDLCTSNIGLTAIQKNYADLTVDQFNFFTNQSNGFCEIILDIATVQHIVFGNFGYSYPLKRHEDVVKLGKHFFSILELYIPGFNLITEKTDKELLSYNP